MRYVVYCAGVACLWDEQQAPAGIWILDEPSNSFWLIPEGAAPIWDLPETVQVAYRKSLVRETWYIGTVSWIKDLAIWPNESLRMFP